MLPALLAAYESGRSKDSRSSHPQTESKTRMKAYKELEYHGATAGGKQPKLYMVWAAIKQRCNNPKCPKYKNYGARGIKMHPAWQESYAEFAQYMKSLGKKPSEKHSIGRIDNDKGYVPGNIQWEPPKLQARKKQTSHFVFYQGKERTLQEVSEMSGVDHRRLQHRVVDQKMSIDEAVNLPLEAGLKYYLYKGENHKLGSWAEILKIPYHVLYDRLHRLKWSVEQTFETPYKARGKEQE
jgi:hypothetical protein